MNRLQRVKYPLCEVLFTWKQIGDMLDEEDVMLLPEVFYETYQRANERAKGCRRRTLTLQVHVSPVDLNAHVIVAPGILGTGMRQAVSSMITIPVPFIPISSMQLLEYIASIRYQHFLRGFGEGRTATSSTLTNCV